MYEKNYNVTYTAFSCLRKFSYSYCMIGLFSEEKKVFSKWKKTCRLSAMHPYYYSILSLVMFICSYFVLDFCCFFFNLKNIPRRHCKFYFVHCYSSTTKDMIFTKMLILMFIVYFFAFVFYLKTLLYTNKLFIVLYSTFIYDTIYSDLCVWHSEISGFSQNTTIKGSSHVH